MIDPFYDVTTGDFKGLEKPSVLSVLKETLRRTSLITEMMNANQKFSVQYKKDIFQASFGYIFHQTLNLTFEWTKKKKFFRTFNNGQKRED